MRRVLSIILFVIGGWILSSEAMIAWVDMDVGLGPLLFALAFFLPFAAIPLALGTWASPGNRLAELGMTLMVAAGVSLFEALTMFLALRDPAVAKMMPPEQPLPDFTVNPVTGAVNLLLIAGSGYLMWRKGRANVRQKESELEQVFGD
jgi:hypothetical protein